MIADLRRAILLVEVVMLLRKVRDAEEARTLLAEVAASGDPRAVWARRHGVNPRSLTHAAKYGLSAAELTPAAYKCAHPAPS